MRKDPREAEDAEARQKAEAQRKSELDDLRDVLSMQSGYNVVFRILRYTRFLESIWTANAEIHKNAGKQEVGNWLFGEVIAAHPETLVELVKEIKRDQQDDMNRKMEEKK